MKTIIIALNSQYIHSSLAPWCLKASCDACCGDVKVREFTINDSLDSILADIYLEKPDVAAFSCYIWNITHVLRLIEGLKKASPHTKIILGGPEVSFDAKELLESNNYADYIIAGEGEVSFCLLLKYLNGYEIELRHIGGAAWKDGSRAVVNSSYEIVERLDRIPSPYTEEMLMGLRNRIVYFESSRGCPFNCAYCLSSTFSGVRYFDMDRVKDDLARLINAGVKQIKFVDRTFNCKKNRAKEILRFILDIHDKLMCRSRVPDAEDSEASAHMPNFHFEAAADLFDDEMLEILSNMPAGLVQFEIGVQTTNSQTLEAVSRKTDLSKVFCNVQRLKRLGNIHLHLDLIAGLPYEDYATFAKSFNEVYSLMPDQLQMGFLKMLKGSALRQYAESYGYSFKDYAPYEVLSNSFLTFGELLELKGIEEIVERYYNSGRFQRTLCYIIKHYEAPFVFFRMLYQYNAERGYLRRSLSSRELYNILKDFIESSKASEPKTGMLINDLLKFDFLRSDNTNNLPSGLVRHLPENFKDLCFDFLKDTENVKKYIPQYAGVPAKQIIKHVHFEVFDYDIFKQNETKYFNEEKTVILFDYMGKDTVTGLYKYYKVDLPVYK